MAFSLFEGYLQNVDVPELAILVKFVGVLLQSLLVFLFVDDD